MSSREDAEEDLNASSTNGYAHAPHWPGTRKTSWWIASWWQGKSACSSYPLISDIPYSRPDADRNYRALKIQFQCPPNTGFFHLEDLHCQRYLRGWRSEDWYSLVEEPTVDDRRSDDDDISDPDENTLTGQMAAMRGGSVKKIRSEESDDKESSHVDSDSDSDWFTLFLFLVLVLNLLWWINISLNYINR